MTIMYADTEVPATREPFSLPSKPDGSNFRFALATGQKIRAADTYTELIGLLVDGYETLETDPAGNDEAAIVRYQFGRSFAASLQADYNIQAHRQRVFAAASAGETDAVFADKSLPFTDRYTGSTHWEAPVPLVLIDGDYHPYTEVPAPTGNIVWVPVVEEQAMVVALHDLGVVVLSDGNTAA